MIYDLLEKDDLLSLLFRADETLQALRDRDEARDDLAKERAKHEEKSKALDIAKRQVDRLREVIKAKESLPSYHQLLEHVCKELGVCGSPTFNEAIAQVKKRLGRR